MNSLPLNPQILLDNNIYDAFALRPNTNALCNRITGNKQDFLSANEKRCFPKPLRRFPVGKDIGQQAAASAAKGPETVSRAAAAQGERRRIAAEAGCAVRNGLCMLTAQAELSWKLWNGEQI